MGGTCSMHGVDQKYVQNFSRKASEKEPPGAMTQMVEYDDVKISTEKRECTDRIQLVENEVPWLAFVDTVINLLVS